ncbi:7-cyano-7-deazaguanine synthase [Candidatus Pacearchaeota archaeon]|nr:7-cyano-7-deazaguanine synthase [Candidatus Pacearchaeota archaeon]
MKKSSVRQKNAIVLCSGGLDSVTTAHYVKKKLNYKKIVILFLNYGQRTIEQERNSAKKCAKDIGAFFNEISLPELAKISTSLINKRVNTEKISKKELANTKKESEKWYVPYRNAIFLIYALALADSYFIKYKEIFHIFTGFKNEGRESYPDTTIKFVDVMNSVQKVVSEGKFKIYALFIKKDKEDIIKIGKDLNIDLKNTFSCYAGAKNNLMHCGTCLSCRLRQEAFKWAGVEDETKYEEE